MKRIILPLLLFVFINAYGQQQNSIAGYDFSSLWISANDRPVYGFVGENYHRIRITIDSVIKSKKDSGTYYIKGHSQLGQSGWSFKGTIKVTHTYILDRMHFGVDDEYKNKGIRQQGILTAAYYFKEEKTDAQSGIFEGLLTSYWYVDKEGNIQYDDIERYSDTYRNNQFEGTWSSWDGRRKVVCNWGDFRIPNSGDLDIGAGEFSPAEKYYPYGWADAQ